MRGQQQPEKHCFIMERPREKFICLPTFHSTKTLLFLFTALTLLLRDGEIDASGLI
jgi:hypothetical protein